MALGILGGTFDPIHLGHLILAQSALEALELERIFFVPAGCPPHKSKVGVPDHRKQMVALAIEDHPRFTLSSIELERDAPSYTYDTVSIFRKRYSDAQIFFIVGGDTLRELPGWYKIDHLIRLCHFAVGIRPNHSAEEIPLLADRFGQAFCNELRRYYFENPLIEISASDIRRRRRSKRSITYLVPAAVERYIIAQDLYR